MTISSPNQAWEVTKCSINEARVAGLKYPKRALSQQLKLHYLIEVSALLGPTHALHRRGFHSVTYGHLGTLLKRRCLSKDRGWIIRPKARRVRTLN